MIVSGQQQIHEVELAYIFDQPWKCIENRRVSLFFLAICTVSGQFVLLGLNHGTVGVRAGHVSEITL